MAFSFDAADATSEEDLPTHTQLKPAEVVRAGLEIAGDICIYTNRSIEVMELS